MAVILPAFFPCANQADPLDHWSVTQTASGSSFRSMAYAKGLFVATAQSGAGQGWLGYSADGMIWNDARCGGAACGPTSLQGVMFANDRFIAVGDQGWVYASTNGVDWMLNVVPPSDSMLWDVSYGDGIFVTVGQMDSCPCGFLAISSDGAQWTPNYIEQILYLRAVAYGNGKFVAVGLSDSGTSFTSENIFSSTNVLGQWVAHSAMNTNDFFSVTFGNGLFAAVGQEHHTGTARIITSSDGGTWTSRALPATNGLRSVSFVDGLFVATGAGGTLLTSTNGTDWHWRATGTTDTLGELLYAKGSLLVLADHGAVLRSDPLVSLRLAVGQQVELSVFGLEGRSYRIEATSDPGASNWPEAASFFLYSSPTLWRDGVRPLPAARFYRAVLLP